MAYVARKDEREEEDVMVIQGVRSDYVLYVRGNRFRVRHPNLGGHFKIPYMHQFHMESPWFAFFTPEFMRPGPGFTNFHMVFQNDVMRHGVAPFLTPEERGALMAMILEMPNTIECDVQDLHVLYPARVSYEYASGTLHLIDVLSDEFRLPDWLRSRLCE